VISVIEEIYKVNESYVLEFKLGDLPMPPSRQLSRVECEEAWVTVEAKLGLKTGKLIEVL
jgi:hypothetical protein